MPDLPPGLATDLAILRHCGSTVEPRGDHLIIRTPGNPDFHWGNCLLVTDDGGLDDAGRWVRTFQAAFPRADWVAIGLIAMPADREAWAAQGLELELDEVLTTRTLPRQTPAPQGYAVRRLDGDDWAQSLARSLAENDRAEQREAPQAYARYATGQALARRKLSDQNVGATFGAFKDDMLVAELGIVRCADTARYQSVGTDEDHRRHGLASHLLGIAAAWAGDHGCNRWVIVTESTNPAGRVYRSVGFEPDTSNAEAYRRPAGRSSAEL